MLPFDHVQLQISTPMKLGLVELLHARCDLGYFAQNEESVQYEYAITPRSAPFVAMPGLY